MVKWRAVSVAEEIVVMVVSRGLSGLQVPVLLALVLRLVHHFLGVGVA